jgi:hypothetical protein
VRKQRGLFRQVLDGSEYEGIGGGQVLNVANKREIESTNDSRGGNDGGVDVIQGSVNMSSARESIGWSHLGSRKDLPYDVEVLKK